MDKRPYVAVVGAANIDICGKPFAPLVPRDSNPGSVTLSLGGVGRNIAHDLALLGVEVTLLTALGQDANAQRVRQSCRDLGIDLTHALEVPGAATSTYLVLTDAQGELALAVSDMGVYDHLTPAYIERHQAILDAAALVAVDTNLPAATLAHLADHCTAPIFADAVSTAKAPKLCPILDRLHTLKVNRMEAELLSGVAISDDEDLRRAALTLLDRGVGRVFLSLGAGGVLAARQGELVQLPIFPGEMKNATGCGDAFMAALGWGHLEGLDLARSAKAGLAAAAIALAGEETINPALSAEKVKQIANL